MLPTSSPSTPTRLPTLRRDLSRLSARNLRRPSSLPHGPSQFGGYLSRLKWLFTGSPF
ncbi:MAG TPA: hypothetical protein VGM74_09825 [Burkholderiaceae bacterium]|jgi:hypothetical protein